MSRKVCIYDSDEVIDKELEAYDEKYGHLPSDDLIFKYLENEMDLLIPDLQTENLGNRLIHTIEEDDGQIWICLKLLNINRLWDQWGTKPK